MKRIGEDVVGRPRPRGLRRDVAGAVRDTGRVAAGSSASGRGALGPQATHAVASFRHATDRLRATRIHAAAHAAGASGSRVRKQEEAALLSEFADFMSVDSDAQVSRWRSPNPVFQERLRRRLWRTHVLAHLSHRGRDGERH